MAEASLEPTGSRLPLAKNNPCTTDIHLGVAGSEPLYYEKDNKNPKHSIIHIITCLYFNCFNLNITWMSKKVHNIAKIVKKFELPSLLFRIYNCSVFAPSILEVNPLTWKNKMVTINLVNNTHW